MTPGQNLILTVFGRKGSGKTTLVKKIVAEFPRVLIVDTNGEYDDAVGIVFHNLDEALEYLTAVSNTNDAFSMAYVPLDMPKDGLDFLEVAFTVPGTLVVLDEAHMYCSSSTMPTPVQKLVRLGRHRSISQVYVAQRPASLPRDITAQSDVVVSFQQHEGRDLEYMGKLFGRSAEGLKTLAPYTVEVFGDVERAPFAVQKQMAKKGVAEQGSLF